MYLYIYPSKKDIVYYSESLSYETHNLSGLYQYTKKNMLVYMHGT